MKSQKRISNTIVIFLVGQLIQINFIGQGNTSPSPTVIADDENQMIDTTTTGDYPTLFPENQAVPTKPLNLTVTEVTSTTITIRFLQPEHLNGQIFGYRVIYDHQNFTDIQTIKNQTSSTITYVLSNLKPYSDYKISVRAFTLKSNGDASDPVYQRTDISGPSAPIVTNLSCKANNALYLRWKRPLEYYNSIDFYIISNRNMSSNEIKEYQFNASATYLETTMMLRDLTPNALYEVKVRAASLSTINKEQIILGSYSDPQKVLMVPNCEELQYQQRKAQSENHWALLVTIILSCVALVLIAISVLLWRKCFHAAYFYLDDPPCQGPTSLIDWEAPVEIGGEIKAAIAVQDFPKHVTELHADGDIGFSKEYESLQNESIVEEYSSEHSQNLDNKAKNRYLNIIAYDHSRVHLRLSPGQKKNQDYINANYIDGYQKSCAFIGTQGPLPTTFDCFWRMIWEQRVAIIVMITNLVERGRRKCDMYWPKDGCETYGVIQVRFIEESAMATYTVRKFQIKHLKLKKKKYPSEKIVYQYHYTNWPDHGTPDHPLPVLNFVKKSADANPSDAGPIVVHCSAGVGRTGTYIVLDAMLKQITQKKVINVFGFLRHIRAQRNFLVQTEEQYIFIHDALLEAIHSGETNIRADVVIDIKDDIELLENQFKLITQFHAKDVHMASALKNVNISKNRSAIVPLEGSRVHLTPKPGEEGSDYINATWLQGFRRLRDFIITQHPLVSTIKDFWQMVWDHNAQTIVLLSSLDDSTSPQFWPDDTTIIQTEQYNVKYLSKMNKCDYLSRDFALQSIQDDYELNVRMLHCPSWPELGHPTAIFDFIVDVHHRSSEYRNGPIIVIDKFGGTQACMFCVISSQAMQMEYDSTTNVYTYAKLYHNKRPGIWKSPDDLRQIYKFLSYLPCDLDLLKCTEIRTELDDITTVTPDLYSKICSNGNISSSLNTNNINNGELSVVASKNNGNGDTGGGGSITNEDNNDEFSVVVTERDNVDM